MIDYQGYLRQKEEIERIEREIGRIAREVAEIRYDRVFLSRQWNYFDHVEWEFDKFYLNDEENCPDFVKGTPVLTVNLHFYVNGDNQYVTFPTTWLLGNWKEHETANWVSRKEEEAKKELLKEETAELERRKLYEELRAEFEGTDDES